METAEHREPCELRGSRTDLGAPGREIPPGDSTDCDIPGSFLLFAPLRYADILDRFLGASRCV